MDEAEQNIQAYESDTNAEEVIRKAITDSYGDLANEAEQVSFYENNELPTFYDRFHGYGMGTGTTDMSPFARLAVATRGMQQQQTAAQGARNVFDIRKGSLEDMVGMGMRRWETGYQGAQNAYARELERVRNEEMLELQRQQMASMSRGYGNPPPTPIPDPYKPPPPGGTDGYRPVTLGPGVSPDIYNATLPENFENGVIDPPQYYNPDTMQDSISPANRFYNWWKNR